MRLVAGTLFFEKILSKRPMGSIYRPTIPGATESPSLGLSCCASGRISYYVRRPFVPYSHDSPDRATRRSLIHSRAGFWATEFGDAIERHPGADSNADG